MAGLPIMTDTKALVNRVHPTSRTAHAKWCELFAYLRVHVCLPDFMCGDLLGFVCCRSDKK